MRKVSILCVAAITAGVLFFNTSRAYAFHPHAYCYYVSLNNKSPEEDPPFVFDPGPLVNDLIDKRSKDHPQGQNIFQPVPGRYRGPVTVIDGIQENEFIVCVEFKM